MFIFFVFLLIVMIDYVVYIFELVNSDKMIKSMFSWIMNSFCIFMMVFLLVFLEVIF